MKQSLESRWKLAALGAGALLILAAVLSAYYFLVVDDRIAAKTTLSRMRQLSTILMHEKVRDLSENSIEQIVKAYGHPDGHLDGWGRSIDVKLELKDDGSLHYRIRSFGQDGIPGNCCRRRVRFDWNEDAVMYDDKWLQAWY